VKKSPRREKSATEAFEEGGVGKKLLSETKMRRIKRPFTEKKGGWLRTAKRAPRSKLLGGKQARHAEQSGKSPINLPKNKEPKVGSNTEGGKGRVELTQGRGGGRKITKGVARHLPPAEREVEMERAKGNGEKKKRKCEEVTRKGCSILLSGVVMTCGASDGGAVQKAGEKASEKKNPLQSPLQGGKKSKGKRHCPAQVDKEPEGLSYS